MQQYHILYKITLNKNNLCVKCFNRRVHFKFTLDCFYYIMIHTSKFVKKKFDIHIYFISSFFLEFSENNYLEG